MLATTTDQPYWVRSIDGTRFACWVSGKGPPLLLVHGTTSLHSTWNLLLPHLEPHFEVITVDQRGRGESQDAPDYDISREYEDVAAVVDQVAAATGSVVDVLGHSFGGECVFGAAALTSRIGRLVLYEGWPVPDPTLVSGPAELLDRLDELLATGRREDLLATFYRELVRLTPDEISALRTNPTWPLRVAAAHTAALGLVFFGRFEGSISANYLGPTARGLRAEPSRLPRAARRVRADQSRRDADPRSSVWRTCCSAATTWRSPVGG